MRTMLVVNYTFRMTTRGGKVDAMTIDSANSRIGIYNTNPNRNTRRWWQYESWWKLNC